MLDKNIDLFLQKSKLFLQKKNYANKTIDTYIIYIKEFLEFLDKSPSKINSNDFEIFINKYSDDTSSRKNQIISSLKIFYEKILNRKFNKVRWERPRNQKKLPDIISKDLLIISLENINNLKHKALLSLAYSIGLRVSEIINLKINDIDSKRMLIKITNSKGGKDRYVPLSNYILILLREYYKKFKPDIYLFNGQSKLKYSPTSCNKLVKKYINTKYTFHSLRHSCFTHMIENGIDIKIIKEIAGHENIITTEKYIKLSNKFISSINTVL